MRREADLFLLLRWRRVLCRLGRLQVRGKGITFGGVFFILEAATRPLWIGWDLQSSTNTRLTLPRCMTGFTVGIQSLSGAKKARISECIILLFSCSGKRDVRIGCSGCAHAHLLVCIRWRGRWIKPVQGNGRCGSGSSRGPVFINTRALSVCSSWCRNLEASS